MARPPSGSSCVVICSSVFGDFTANYHRERRLGRTLPSRGHAAIRFHYNGEGNSEGERQEMTFSSLCKDAAAVVDHAKSLGFIDFAVLGTRIGALVAAAIVAPKANVPLVLWEPVISPMKVIADAQRARRISRTARGGRQPIDSNEALEGEGVVDLLGYDVYPPMMSSISNIDLLSTLGYIPRPIFIGRFHSQEEADQRLAQQLTERGCSVELRGFGFSESWWFQNELEPETGDLIGATTAWLADLLPSKV